MYTNTPIEVASTNAALQNPQQLKPGIIPNEQIIQDGKIQPRVWNAHMHTEVGPIAAFAKSTLYDLLVEQSVEMEFIRQSFHDWAIPPVITISDGRGGYRAKLKPIKVFQRGKVTDTTFAVEHYLYAVLNHNLVPVSSFGDINHMPMNRTQTLVCVNVGDPRTGKLDKAYIEYAIPLNTAIGDCVNLAHKDHLTMSNKIQYYYRLESDEELMKRIGAIWFNDKTYVFNAGIYPRARNFVQYD